MRRIGSLLGRPEAVKAIHGGVRRPDRRQITEEFTSNPTCQVLLATDAAGEGLNLQAAHLMVNYDLPWNPNRIEQRFGRIHRIGQQEVCRLWNLVADNTREGEVFLRLLAKIEEQRKAYGGKVFDVLGTAFGETPLRTLLIDAIRYGELPETRAKMEQVIDASVAHGIDELLAERALVTDTLQRADIAQLRALMDEARARRLQPHYIEGAFRAAFTRLGGKIRRRERGRFEITHVPAQLRTAGRGPIATRYDRVTFDIEHVLDDTGARAELLAPGHPLHDAVTDETVARWHRTLDRGTVLVSPSCRGAAPARRRHRGDRRCDGDRGRAPFRLRVHRRARRSRGGRAGAVPRLRRRTADERGHRGPRAAVARRGRGAGGELDHRQPAAGVPQRGQDCAARPSSTACATRWSDAWIRRATASSSRRWSPRSRSRPGRNPRRATRA